MASDYCESRCEKHGNTLRFLGHSYRWIDEKRAGINCRWLIRSFHKIHPPPQRSHTPKADITPRSGISPTCKGGLYWKRALASASALFPGGEGGIRTRETLLTPTRFPVVRLRPAQPPLHFCADIRSLKSACISYSIFHQKSSLFWDFFANVRESLDYPLTLWVKYDIILLTYRDDGKFFRRHLTIPTPARPETP